MKNIFRVTKFSFLIFSLSIFFTSCKEIGPEINFNPSGNIDTLRFPTIDTTQFTNQQKNILLEEITGVKCPNCPQGHESAALIYDAHPGRVSLVAIHNGFYAVPYPFSVFDFKIPEGENIDNFILGTSSVWPTGAVDRKLYPGEAEKLITRNKWATKAIQQLNENPKVLISLNKAFDTASRNIKVTVGLKYLQTVNENNNVSVMITESGMIDAQDQPNSVVDTFYHHRNVLRGMLTPYNGDAIIGNKTAGALFTKYYQMPPLPASWNVDSCKIITFVSYITDSVSVLQTVETSLR